MEGNDEGDEAKERSSAVASEGDYGFDNGGQVRVALFALAGAGFVSGTTIRIAEPLIPVVTDAFAVGLADASALITGFTVSYAAFQLVHGPLADRFGKLRIVAVTLFLSALGSLACGLAADLESLIAFRFLTGASAGAVVPLSVAFVGDNVPLAQRQTTLGRFISGILLGQAMGPLLGGICSDYFGWRSGFWVIAVGYLVVAAVVLPIALRERVAEGAERRGPFASYRLLSRSPWVRFVCLAVMVEAFLFYGAFGFVGAFLKQQLEVSYTVVGLLTACFGVGGIVYSASVSSLMRSLGQRRMVCVGGAILLVAFAAFSLISHWAIATVAIVGLGFGFYMMHNTLQTLSSEMMPEVRGAAASGFAFCLFAGQAAGVFVLGHAIEAFDFEPVFAVIGFALLLLSWRIARAINRPVTRPITRLGA